MISCTFSSTPGESPSLSSALIFLSPPHSSTCAAQAVGRSDIAFVQAITAPTCSMRNSASSAVSTRRGSHRPVSARLHSTGMAAASASDATDEWAPLRQAEFTTLRAHTQRNAQAEKGRCVSNTHVEQTQLERCARSKCTHHTASLTRSTSSSASRVITCCSTPSAVSTECTCSQLSPAEETTKRAEQQKDQRKLTLQGALTAARRSLLRGDAAAYL
jgi:hypothetical protein